VRVRFWPSERQLDGRVSLEGFAEALGALQQCVARCRAKQSLASLTR